MAYIPYDDEELNAMLEGQQGGTARPNYGPSSLSNPSSSSRFINFGKYFSANRGAANQAADNLTQGLQSSAQATQDAALKAQQGLSAQAAAAQGVTPFQGEAATASAAAIREKQRRVEEANMEKQQEYGYAPTTYAGPTPSSAGVDRYLGPTRDNVAATFAPLDRQANDVTKQINQTTDAAGVKALQKQSGFDAALTRQAGVSQLSGLRQKYGKLADTVRTARNDTGSAVDKAQATNAANAQAWASYDRDTQQTQANTAADWERNRQQIYKADLARLTGQQQEEMRRALDARAQAAKQRDAHEMTGWETDEPFAQRYGLTLEEYIRAGRPNLSTMTPEQLRRLRGAR